MPDPALLERIGESLRSGLRPVRPLPPNWLIFAGMFALFTGLALLGATLLGFFGLHRLSDRSRCRRSFRRSRP